jgi:hypothetical protein
MDLESSLSFARIDEIAATVLAGAIQVLVVITQCTAERLATSPPAMFYVEAITVMATLVAVRNLILAIRITRALAKQAEVDMITYVVEG